MGWRISGWTLSLNFFFVVIFLRDMEVEIVPVLFCSIGVLLQRWVGG